MKLLFEATYVTRSILFRETLSSRTFFLALLEDSQYLIKLLFQLLSHHKLLSKSFRDPFDRMFLFQVNQVALLS